jgi:hypothetical protein
MGATIVCEWCGESVNDEDHDTFACASVLRVQRDDARAKLVACEEERRGAAASRQEFEDGMRASVQSEEAVLVRWQALRTWLTNQRVPSGMGDYELVRALAEMDRLEQQEK